MFYFKCSVLKIIIYQQLLASTVVTLVGVVCNYGNMQTMSKYGSKLFGADSTQTEVYNESHDLLCMLY